MGCLYYEHDDEFRLSCNIFALAVITFLLLQRWTSKTRSVFEALESRLNALKVDIREHKTNLCGKNLISLLHFFLILAFYRVPELCERPRKGCQKTKFPNHKSIMWTVKQCEQMNKFSMIDLSTEAFPQQSPELGTWAALEPIYFSCCCCAHGSGSPNTFDILNAACQITQLITQNSKHIRLDVFWAHSRAPTIWRMCQMN